MADGGARGRYRALRAPCGAWHEVRVDERTVLDGTRSTVLDVHVSLQWVEIGLNSQLVVGHERSRDDGSHFKSCRRPLGYPFQPSSDT
eukprot:4820708-Prymnesium_polylepis.1